MSVPWPLLLLATATLALAACADGGAPSATPSATPSLTAVVTATPTPTPVPTPPPLMESFRTFAVQIDDALAAGDTSFFIDRAVEQEWICTEPTGVGSDLCAYLPAGTVLRGIKIFSDRIIDYYPFLDPEYSLRRDFPISREEYTAFWEQVLANARPELSDEVGTGAATLYAIYAFFSGDIYVATVTGIFRLPQLEDEMQRLAFDLHFQFVDGRWRLGTTTFLASAEEALSCPECHNFGQRWEGSSP